MNARLQVLVPVIVYAVLASGCSTLSDAPDPELSPAKASVARPFKMSRADFTLDWGITRDQELECGGDEIAGGEISGIGNFTHLGRSRIKMSAAWDIGSRITDPNEAQFSPVGPAGGPFAPVLGPDDYPYDFHFDPFTSLCEAVVSATGELELTAANGAKVYGAITGGETHRLDFVLEGDGIETFAIIEIVGGTGRFGGATGSFVVHTITRFDFATGRFVIDLAEVLPGGTIRY
jgi:hypothetical protein